MCYNKRMKIVFPEIINNKIARRATQKFGDVTFIPADSLADAVELLQRGEADSMISGLDYPSRDVLLAYKGAIRLRSEFFTSCFICEKSEQVLAIADGGVIKHPTKEQLVVIVEDTVRTFQAYTGEQPKIALLSYSTHGSGGKDQDFEKIRAVIDEIKRRHKDWVIDGELQLDAAINPLVAERKTPDGPLRGQANILITPDLNSGNILYKSLEQFGGFTVAGPIIQGFSIPLADLSRGSTLEDTIMTIKVLRSLL